MPPKRKGAAQKEIIGDQVTHSVDVPKRSKREPKTKKPEEQDDDEIIEDVKPKRATRKAQEAKTISVKEPEQDDDEIIEEKVKPKRANRKAQETKTTSVKEPEQENDEITEEVKPKRATRKVQEPKETTEKEPKESKKTKEQKKVKKNEDTKVKEPQKIMQIDALEAKYSKEKTNKEAKTTKSKKEDVEKTENGKETKKDAKETTKVKNQTSSSYDEIDFTCTTKNENGEDWNFKISGWNVDGMRAWIKKGGLEYVDYEKPDIFCIQETKCSLDKIPPEAKLEGYYDYWFSAEKDGYSSVGLYTKIKPIAVKNGFGNKEHDSEGRIITAEYEKFYFVNVYVPNAGRGLVTLPKKLDWNEEFKKYISELDQKKPVIICGDLNVAHLEIDLTNPKTNKKNAGFTQEERDGMTDFIESGFTDSFRKLYPDKENVYTFWTYMGNCRAKNVGWRLDYFLVSNRLMPSVCDNLIRTQVFGSDHCPHTLFLHI